MKKTMCIMVTVEASSENEAVLALDAFRKFANELNLEENVEVSYDFSTTSMYYSRCESRGKLGD